MIEKIILKYLLDNGIKAYMEVPENPEDGIVVINKTGSGVINCIKSAVFAIQSYGNSLIEAAELNETIKALMENIVVLDEICACSLNTDYNYTDTRTKKYRYQAVFNITHY